MCKNKKSNFKVTKGYLWTQSGYYYYLFWAF